jgi:alpha-beta hydrolase superfamily lysophospholipase
VKLEAQMNATPAPAKGATTPLPAIAWIGGGIAALSLAACLALPLLVFFGGSDPVTYARNMDSYKTGLMVATVLYFVGGIVWTVQREKARGEG